PLFDIEESYYYGIVPTATPFARNAIFSGMFPMEIAARHPEWWGQPSDEESLNAHEPELLSEQLADLLGKPVPVRYEKLFTSNDGPELLRKLPAHLAQEGVTALVFNCIDQLTHGLSESAILYEVARDSDALRGLTRTRFERSPVRAARAAQPAGRAAHPAPRGPRTAAQRAAGRPAAPLHLTVRRRGRRDGRLVRPRLLLLRAAHPIAAVAVRRGRPAGPGRPARRSDG